MQVLLQLLSIETTVEDRDSQGVNVESMANELGVPVFSIEFANEDTFNLAAPSSGSALGENFSKTIKLDGSTKGNMLPETSIPPLVVKEVTSTFTTFDTKGILDGAPYKANETPLKLPRALPSAALQITEANVAPLPDKTDGVIIDSAKSSRVAEQSDNNQVLKGPALSALPRPEKGFKSTTTPPSRSDKVAMPTTPSTTTFLDGQLVQMKADQVVQSLPIQVAKASATVTFGARSDVSTPSTGTALKAVPDQVETPVLKPIGQASDRSNRLAPSHKGENLEVASTHKRDSSLETPSTEIAQDKSKPKGSMPLEITYRAATIGAVDPRNPDTNRFAGTSTNTLRTEPQLALQSQTIPSAATSMEIGYRDHKAYGRTPPSPQASEKEKSAQNSHSIRNSPAVPLTAQGVPVIPVVGTSPFEKTAAMDGAQPKDFAINLAPVPDSPEARRENTTSPKIETVVRPVIQQLVNATKNADNGSVEVRLSPEELGRVRLSLSPGEAIISVHISVERPETMELIRRNIELFSQSLKQEGFSGFSFTFSDSGTGQSSDDGDGSAREFAADVENTEGTDVIKPNRHKSLDGRLDIRI